MLSEWCPNSMQGKSNVFQSMHWNILSLGKRLQTWLNWIYKRFLMRVKNTEWTQHCTFDQIYDNLTIMSDYAKARRYCFPGHWFQVTDEVIYDLIFCDLLHRQRGRKQLAYHDTLAIGENLPPHVFKIVMEDRGYWRTNYIMILQNIGK